MNTFLHLLTVAGFLVIVWYFRIWIKEVIEYKYSRRQEIKRRLQVEHKQEQALKIALKGPLDDKAKFELVTKFADERHQRAIHYTIEDMFERYQ